MISLLLRIDLGWRRFSINFSLFFLLIPNDPLKFSTLNQILTHQYKKNVSINQIINFIAGNLLYLYETLL